MFTAKLIALLANLSKIGTLEKNYNSLAIYDMRIVVISSRWSVIQPLQNLVGSGFCGNKLFEIFNILRYSKSNSELCFKIVTSV